MAQSLAMSDNYAYNMMSELVNYTKDSSKFSPNNIRRIIVSPNALLMLQHVQFGGKNDLNMKPYNSVKLNPLKYSADLMNPKAKGIFLALTERIPQLLEEVVICRKGIGNSGVYLLEKDSNITALLRGYTGNGSDVESLIKKRYKRLASVIIYDGTIEEFYTNTFKYYKPTDLLKDVDFVKSCCQVYTLNEDWYNATSGQANSYELDRGGSRLIRHLESVKLEVSSSLHNKAVKEMTDAETKKEVDKFKAEMERCNKYLSIYNRLRKLVTNNKLEGIESDLQPLQRKSLLKCNALDDIQVSKFFTIEESSRKEKVKLTENISMVQKVIMQVYYSVVKTLLLVLNEYNTKYPVSCKAILENWDRAIFVPRGLGSLNDSLPLKLEGKRMTDGIQNCCALLSVILANDNEFGSKEAWKV